MLLPQFTGLLTVPPALDPLAATGRAPAIPGLPEYRLAAASTTRADGLAAPNLWLGTLWLLRIFPDAAPGRPWTRGDRRVDYGDVLDSIVDPWLLWNAHDQAQTFGSLTVLGSLEGQRLSQPHQDPPQPPPGNPPRPTPPADLPAPDTLLPGAQLRFDVEILEEGIPYFDTIFSFGFPEPVAFRILGARSVVVSDLPDWTAGVQVDFSVTDDIFASDRRLEQRTSAYDDTEESHVFRIQYRHDIRDEHSRLWNRLHRTRHRRTLVPFFVDLWNGQADAAGSDTVTVAELALEDQLFRSDLVIRLDRSRPGWFELRRVEEVDEGAGTVRVGLPWTEPVPVPHQAFAFAVPVQASRTDRQNRSDAAQVINLTWSEA